MPGQKVKASTTEPTITSVTYIDSNGDTAQIPVGFCIVKGSSSISDGLVISDVADDDMENSKQGNQFVWIPVGTLSNGIIVEYKRHIYDYTDVTNSGNSDSENNWVDKDGWKTYHYSAYSDWEDTGGNTNSVKNNNGFYIGRYEAGYSTSVKGGDTYISSDAKNVATGIPLSKKGAVVWNYISQENALEVAVNMYIDNDAVTSQLVDGYAWDAVTQWLQNSEYNVTDSTSWGNYLDSIFSINSGIYAVHTYADNKWTYATTYNEATAEAPYTKPTDKTAEMATGISERNKAKNIYDLAGNMYEWTTEIGHHNIENNTITYAVHRGGVYDWYGSDDPVSFRHGTNFTTQLKVLIGFRVVLYVK